MDSSNQTYAQAIWAKSLVDWTGSHVRAFVYLGAVPLCIVTDSLLSAIS